MANSPKTLAFYMSRMNATGGTDYITTGTYTGQTIQKMVLLEDTTITAITEKSYNGTAASTTPAYLGVSLPANHIITFEGVCTGITLTGSALIYNEDPVFLDEHAN